MHQIDRVPPQDIDAERALLGALMLPDENEDVLPEVIADLDAEIFYREAHQKIFHAIVDLQVKGKKVDLVTVQNALEKNGGLEKVGGVPYLDEMIESCPSAANAMYYAEIVTEQADRRRLIHTAVRLAEDAHNQSMELDPVLGDMEDTLSLLQSRKLSRKPTLVKFALKDTFKRINDLYQQGESTIGLPSGFKDLDNLISGFVDGDLIIVAARPGMGKSVLVQNIAQHVSIEQEKPVLLFSLEMSKESLVLRLLSALAGIGLTSLRTGNVKEDEWGKLTINAGKLSSSRFHIVDDTRMTVRKLRARLLQLRKTVEPALVILDYLQLMSSDRDYPNREQEISEISRGLKEIAMECEIPVIAVSQLNRSCEMRPGKRPQLSDLRESGALEQDADLVLLIFREKYYDKTLSQDVAEIEVAKHRNGPTGRIKLVFRGKVSRFDSMAFGMGEVE